MTTKTNLKALYISLFFTTSLVKLFVVTVQIFVYQFLFTIVFFLEGGKTTLTKPFIFWNESTFLKKAHIGNERSFWNLFWSKKNIKLYNPKLITVGIIRGSRLKSRATEPAKGQWNSEWIYSRAKPEIYCYDRVD